MPQKSVSMNSVTRNFLQSLTPLIGVLMSIISLNATAQTQVIFGKVVEMGRGESVPFAHIVWRNGDRKMATISNIEGSYKLVLQNDVGSIDSVWISCIGYDRHLTTIDNLQSDPIIRMKPASVGLGVVIIKANEDPAYEIMRRAIRNRSRNDPENLDHFTFESYNKAAIDVQRSDSVQAVLDSTGFAKSHFFMLESITDVMYKKAGKWSEKVKANQMTGFKNPTFGLLSNSFQPFSVYPSQINVLEFDFLNPLSPGSDSQYVFELIDSTYVQDELAYIITFQPKNKALGNLMKGAITIGSSNYAVVNFRGSNAGEFALVQFEIRQDYTKMGNSWFPTGSKTYYIILDEDVPLLVTSTTYHKNINLEYAPTAKDLGVVQVTYDENSNKVNDEEWTKLRPFELDTFESNSYKTWDTLPTKVVNTMSWFMSQSASLARGRLSLGKTDLLLTHLLRYNEYEGLRLGAGLATNEKLVKWMSLEGYFGYGFRDEELKYGGGVVFPINMKRELEFSMRYYHDVDEPGRGFTDDDRVSFTRTGEAIRNLYTSRMNPVNLYKASLSYRPLRGVLIKAFATQEERAFENRDYVSDIAANPPDVFNTEVGLSIRIVPKESLMQLGQALIPVEIRYPRIDVSVRKALEGVLDGSQNYVRADVAVKQEFSTGRFGMSQLYGGFGKVWGENVLYPWLQFSQGVKGPKSDFGIQSVGYFQTMGLYDFLNDEYGYAGIIHNFGPIFRIEEKFTKPELKLSYAAAIGSLSNGNSAQIPFEYREMNKPYLEAGMVLDNLLRYTSNIYYNGFGIGIFYKHGYYEEPSFDDNLSFIISFAIGI